MTAKNRGVAAGLAGAVETAEPPRPAFEARDARPNAGPFAGRSNRLAELASGALVSAAQERVDPARCRMWSEHNRDYGLLNETNCADLIESLESTPDTVVTLTSGNKLVVRDTPEEIQDKIVDYQRRVQGPKEV